MLLRIGKLLLSIAAICCLCLAGFAQSSGNKVAVVSIQEAIVKTKEGQKASQQLDAKFRPKQKEFEQRQTEITQLEDQLNKGGSVLNEEKRNQLSRDIDSKKKRLERDVSDARDELTAEQQRLLQGLGQRLAALIEKYAKDKGYSLVLDVSNPNTPVLYASPTIDLTQEIITQYDQTSPTAH